MGSILAEAARDALLGNDAVERLQVRVVGSVQGVGFRPFVYRLARELELSGWVLNDGNGVTIEVEGPHSLLLRFVDRLQKEKPPPALIYALDHRFLSLASYDTFEIRASQSQGSPRVWILPDLATCSECRNEILSPLNRRYRYPFTNCTHCGPRFTIINSLPYDRPRTSMKDFLMCPKCEEEYVDPQDRRFHAQPNACSDCGPGLEFRTTENTLAKGDRALQAAEKWIRIGRVVAVKGLGGYHLMVDARNETAVARLRRRKRRSQKAFAVMYPDLEALRRHVDIPSLAEPILLSAQAPILLLERTLSGSKEIAPSVAPGSPYLGVFLPYTPLHLLLLRDLGFPVVATSGNRADEPIENQDSSALKNLASLCDAFLVHNRPIAHHADDSVLQIITKPRVKPQMLRRARGYTPLPVLAPRKLPPLLALGGHLNATFAVSRDKEIILSQHLGDLESYETRQVYEKTLEELLKIYDIQPKAVVHDLHPDYYTSELAAQFDLPQIAIQHHHAHLAACVLENQLEGSVLGLTWDGTGYGPDHTIWGGEILLGDSKDYQRVGSLCPFQLPGGERGIKEPWRVALSLLWESFGESFPRDLPLFSAVTSEKIEATLEILKRSRLSPVTTSMGRLFDGVSALLGLSFYNTHQAQSAQLLEYAAWEFGIQEVHLPLPVRDQDILRLDWTELVRALVDEYRQGTSPQQLAAGFHQAVTQAALEVARRIAQPRVVLTGGVFCNRYLTENLLTHLEETGFQGYIHSQLPPTDGSLAVGQLWAAAHKDTAGLDFFPQPGHSQTTRR